MNNINPLEGETDKGQELQPRIEEVFMQEYVKAVNDSVNWTVTSVVAFAIALGYSGVSGSYYREFPDWPVLPLWFVAGSSVLCTAYKWGIQKGKEITGKKAGIWDENYIESNLQK